MGSSDMFSLRDKLTEFKFARKLFKKFLFLGYFVAIWSGVPGVVVWPCLTGWYFT